MKLTRTPAAFLVALLAMLALATSAGAAITTIIDNNGVGFARISGTWNTSTSDDCYPDTYRWAASSTSATGMVEWKTLLDPGEYEVSVWYPAGTKRPTDAHYTVSHGGVNTEVVVDQTQNAGGWFSLGLFQFQGLASERVTLTNKAEAGKNVAADAVKFRNTYVPPVNLHMAVRPEGSGTCVPAAGATHVKLTEQVVDISATPAEGFEFVGWEVSAGAAAADPAALSTTVLMDVEKTVTAVFRPIPPEFRAMWITRFEWPNKDWDKARANIDTFFDKVKAANFNAVIVQMRGQADTLYPSPYEPWSQIIANYGTIPDWDPMQYAIDAAHARGLEFHAYINTHVCWQSTAQVGPADPNHLFYRHTNPDDPTKADWIIHDANGLPKFFEESGYVWMAPGVPDFQAYTRQQVMYVVNKYDVDGVHFDRIRTPRNVYSHDPISMARIAGEGNPGQLDFGSWTRDQITRMLSDLYAEIQEVKPWIKVSSAPLGLYRGLSYKDYGYPQSDCGYLYGYTCVYQDAQGWLKSGAMDFIVPQIYWADGGNNPDFSEVLPDWLANAGGRHVYPGQTNVVGTANLVDEVNVTRAMGGLGNVVFSYSGFNTSNNWTAYAGPGGPYEKPAPIPPMPWKTNPTDGTILGNIFGPDGVTPIVDAQIRRTGTDYAAVSSADGIYSFLKVEPGVYDLTVTKSGYDAVTVPGVSVSAGGVVRINITIGVPGGTAVARVGEFGQQADGTRVEVGPVISSTDSAEVMAGYVQAPDYSAGLRVETASKFNRGRSLKIVGNVASMPTGEKFLKDAIAVLDSPGFQVHPMITRAGSASLPYGFGPSTVGLLLQVTGRVIQADGVSFTVSDGSSIGLQVFAPHLDTIPQPGGWVTVTGVGQMGGQLPNIFPLLRPRNQQDVVVHM